MVHRHHKFAIAFVLYQSLYLNYLTIKSIKMKSTIKIYIIAILCSLLFGYIAFSQTVDSKKETFKVYGNCEMCKDRIEGSLKKKDGILKKDWSPKTKMISVTYDPSKITLKQIKQKIADVGYDNDEIRAKDEDYKKLHTCCQYERAKM